MMIQLSFRHILECGGDTTWMLLPSPNSSGRRTRKWRPFGSRRRRQQGSHRRGMKRNIPTTPVKQYFRARHRSVAGDSTCNNIAVKLLPFFVTHTLHNFRGQ